MNETKAVARWVAETRFEALPADVIEHVRISIVDSLACGFAGARRPWTDMVAEMVREGSRGNCSLFGRTWTTSASSAALINGVAIGGFETDAPFSPGNCHPSGAVLPAVLAAAEMHRIDGRELIAATALGYEALCHVGSAATRAVEDERGYHGPATNAPFGGAFGAGRVLGLDAATMTNAIGIAGSHGAGLLEFHREGAMTKRLHLGRGSQLGLESALLAQKGFTGPSTVLEGNHGFLKVYSPSPKPERLLEDLGETWLLKGMTFKAYPCHLSFHAVVDAIHRFKVNHCFTAADVEGVEVRSSHRMMEDRFAERKPTSLMGAQYSLPWSTAHALLRDAADPSTWSDSALNDKDVNRLAATVKLTAQTTGTSGSVAEVILTILGERHVIPATSWKGAPTNPATFDDMVQKLRHYAAGTVPHGRVQELTERIGQIELEQDVGRLIALIRP